MSLRDIYDTFADAVAVTATAISDVKVVVKGYSGTNQSNTVADLGNLGRPLYLVLACDEAATADGAATVTFTLETDSAVGLDASVTTHITTEAIGKASLTPALFKRAYALPQGSYEKYMGVRATVATGPLTAGKFSYYLTDAVDSSIKVYAQGSEIA
jgi:hypothetical protein